MGTSLSGWLGSVLAVFLHPILARLDRTAMPRYDGVLVLPGLTGRVQVQFDEYAIPHVAAENEQDLFISQGYLHAQERLWQMDLSRRFLCGRVAEAFGAFPVPWQELTAHFKGRNCVDFDYYMRLAGIRSAAEEAARVLTETDRRRLNAYSAGVNAYIARCDKKLPWEFRVLRLEPEPWQPVDCLTVGKGLAFLLSVALFTRLNTIALCDRLRDNPQKLQTLRLHTGHIGERRDSAAAIKGLADALTAAADLNSGGHGSNSWVVGPSRSQSGGAILCNDPHLRLNLPSTWYLMHLRHADTETLPDGYEAWGATIPGMPCIHVGHNRAIAWGITAGLCDDVDLYREQLHPLDKNRYLDGHNWRQFTSRDESIRVRGGLTQKRVVRSSHHGPLISDFNSTSATHQAIAFKWTGHEASHESDALYRLNCAGNWQEFLAALAHHRSPSLNFTYCDRDGNIGYALAGAVPVRHQPASLLPLEGWNADGEWSGDIPFDRLPRTLNPPSGVIASANQNMISGGYPYYLSHLFEPPFRYEQITNRLPGQQKMSTAAAAAIQMDTTSLHALKLLRTINTDLRAAAELDATHKPLVNLLLEWNGDCDATSAAAALFHVFHQKLLANLLKPCLDEVSFARYLEIFNQCLAPTDAILADETSLWFSGESRAQMIARSLRQAAAELEQQLGSDREAWQWGKLHRLSANHALGRLPLLRKLLGVGPFATSGDGTTINLGFYRHSAPFAQTVGASLRMVIDMGNARESGFVILGGQSGHVASKHYRDQVQLWREGRRIPLSQSKDALEGRPILELLPS